MVLVALIVFPKIPEPRAFSLIDPCAVKTEENQFRLPKECIFGRFFCQRCIADQMETVDLVAELPVVQNLQGKTRRRSDRKSVV